MFRTFCISIICALGLACVMAGSINAQAPMRLAAPGEVEVDSNAIHLKSGRIPLARESSLERTVPVVEKSSHYVVQLDGPLSPQRLASLRHAGVTLGDYLPVNAYVVRLEKGFDLARRLGGLGFVRWIGPFEKNWKLDADIGSHAFESAARQADLALGRVQLVVALFEGSDADAAAEAIAALPEVNLLTTESSGGEVMIELTMPLAGHDRLADIDAVQWVEESPELTLRNNTNKWILQTNVSNSTTVWDKGIHGEAQVGHVCDGPMKSSHCSFSDPSGNPIGATHRKILAYFGTAGSDSHGTHVAGTMAGDEQPVNGTTTFRGLAYLAKIVFTSTSQITTTNLFTRLEAAHNAGARIHTNSWGNDGTTSYINWTRDVNKFTHTYEDNLVIFSVTNINSAIKTPENAKNCLAVAACTDNPATGHCSGGFAFTNDGRRKPELMAPGCATMSSQASSAGCNFIGSGFTGTSMAAPAVAGAALLARQYYTDGFYPSGTATPGNAFTPSGALIRATLINSGADVTGIAGFPSNQEGWGRVLLENALYFAGDARKLVVLDDVRNAVGLTTGQSRSYPVNVNSAGSPLEVTLAWTEKEAALNANPAFINNLNLEVVAPGGTAYKGNDFASGQSTTGGAFDTKNNAEQVLRTSPTVGAYTINITAPTVNTTTPQGFALVVTGDVSVTAPAPTVISILPNAADADTSVSITNLAGTNFQTSGTTQVRLTRSGYPDVAATGVSVSSSSQITCTFNLSGVEVGMWTVVVTNPDLQVATLADSFEVTVTCLKGDVNNDGGVNALDIARFAELMTQGGGLAVEKCAGDVEAVPDNQIDLQDISNFVDCVAAAGC